MTNASSRLSPLAVLEVGIWIIFCISFQFSQKRAGKNTKIISCLQILSFLDETKTNRMNWLYFAWMCYNLFIYVHHIMFYYIYIIHHILSLCESLSSRILLLCSFWLVNCPSGCPLYLSLLGSLCWSSSWCWWPHICGNAFFRPLRRAGLVVFDPFFLAKCKFCICDSVRKAYEKLKSFSECFGPQNSLLLSVSVSFPEMRGTPQFRKSLSLQK